MVATEEKIDRYLLAGKGFIFSSVRLFIPPVQSGRDFNGKNSLVVEGGNSCLDEL